MASLKGVRMPRCVLIKSRNRIYGKKATTEEISKEIANMAASDLSMGDSYLGSGIDEST